MIATSCVHSSALRAAAVLLPLAFGGCDAGAGSPAPIASASDLGLFTDVVKQVEKNYVEPVPGTELVKDALKGMLSRLDPHSDYMDQEQYQQDRKSTRLNSSHANISYAV